MRKRVASLMPRQSRSLLWMSAYSSAYSRAFGYWSHGVIIMPRCKCLMLGHPMRAMLRHSSFLIVSRTFRTPSSPARVRPHRTGLPSSTASAPKHNACRHQDQDCQNWMAAHRLALWTDSSKVL